VIAPRVADPAVLVDVHTDLRLSLRRLVGETGVELAARYTITMLATGCIDLAPTLQVDATAGGSRVEVRVDDRDRLCLTKGLVSRLAVPVGNKVLASITPDTGEIRLLNLATCADAINRVLNEDDFHSTNITEGAAT